MSRKLDAQTRRKERTGMCVALEKFGEGRKRRRDEMKMEWNVRVIYDATGTGTGETETEAEMRRRDEKGWVIYVGVGRGTMQKMGW